MTPGDIVSEMEWESDTFNELITDINEVINALRVYATEMKTVDPQFDEPDSIRDFESYLRSAQKLSKSAL